MVRFLAGFAAASVLWVGAGAYAVVGLGWAAPEPEAEPEAVAVATDPVAEEDEPSPTRRRRVRSRTTGTGATERGASGDLEAEATTGDDLGEDEMRTIDGEGTGGEAQLTGDQIESAFDGAMGRIRRCFLLAPEDSTVTGRLTFGLRIAGTGRVSAVNLTGPSGITAGECGECLRDAARGMSFPSFDGPEMVVRYPITLE